MQSTTNNKNDILFAVRRNDVVGRYAIAETDLKAGNVIFSETPFAFGPKSDCSPLCLGCYIPVDCSVRCSTCGWPVCRKACETAPAHKKAECAVFSRAKALFQDVPSTGSCLQYECVTPLRVLLASLHNQDRWNREVSGMEAHNSTRRNLPIWKFNQINIVNYLRGPCKLSYFSDDLIHTVCGILECNAFEAHTKSGYPIRCLFPKLAIPSHNCISNIVHTIAACDEFKVTVRAATDISKGEELFSGYTYALWPTKIRREHLLESKYFHCSCNRCEDPNELGTHISSLLCKKCMGTLTSSNGAWKCANCSNSILEGDVRTLFNNVQNEIDAADDAQKLEALLLKYNSVLHSQNSYLIIIKSSLIDKYNVQNDHEKLLQYCRDVLDVINIIKPGYTRIRGTVLYKMFLSILTSVMRLQSQTELGYAAEQLNEALHIGQECTKILSLESIGTVEGVLGKIARIQHGKLAHNFDDIVNGSYSVQDVLNVAI